MPSARLREALDAAVGRAPGVLADRAAERARLRRDVAAALGAAGATVAARLRRRDYTHSNRAIGGTPAP